mgnify:CR=1 FL=1
MENKIEVATLKPEVIFSDNDAEYRLISTDTESNMDGHISNFKSFISNETGQGMSEEEKDVVYVKAQEFIKGLKRELRDAKFKVYINRPQYNFLTGLVLQKLEYDVDTVFIAIELTSLMAGMKELKYKDDKEYLSTDMTPTEVTYLYHLISTHKVKGLTRDAYLFAGILRRIGEISKIVNYYDNESKEMTKDIANWAVNLGGGELIDELQKEEDEIEK